MFNPEYLIFNMLNNMDKFMLNNMNLTCCAYQLCKLGKVGKSTHYLTCKGSRHNWNSDILETFPI